MRLFLRSLHRSHLFRVIRALAGYQIAHRLKEGYQDEAKAIRVHMQYEFTTDAEHLTEADMICLGDRLVLEDKYVGIDQRMDYIIAKAERHGNFEARPAILRKKEETRVLLNQIENRIGMSLDTLMSDIDYD